MDTGADTTVLPEELLQLVGLTPVRTTTVVNFSGARTQHPVYFARVSVESFAFPLVRCICVQHPHALIGRDILNQLVITLDGPNLTFTATQP